MQPRRDDSVSTSTSPEPDHASTTANANNSSSSGQAEPTAIYDAAELFLLMRHEFRVSRNVRAKWLFDNLNRVLYIEHDVLTSLGRPPDAVGGGKMTSGYHKDLRVVGVIPEQQQQPAAPARPNELIGYRVHLNTRLTFLSNTYRLVFVLDFSPSTIVVDKCSGQILYGQMLECLKHCLTDVVQPMKVPGCPRPFTPRFFITIVAFNPLLVCTAEQVLLQGCRLTRCNVIDVLEHVENALERYVETLSAFARPLLRRTDVARKTLREERQHELITGYLFADDDVYDAVTPSGKRSVHPTSSSMSRSHHRHLSFSSFTSDPAARLEKERRLLGERDPSHDPKAELAQCAAAIGLVPSEWALLNMLRLGLLAIQLLPENTQANIVVLTDGVVGTPDSTALQALLAQLRSFTVPCSFIQIRVRHQLSSLRCFWCPSRRCRQLRSRSGLGLLNNSAAADWRFGLVSVLL